MRWLRSRTRTDAEPQPIGEARFGAARPWPSDALALFAWRAARPIATELASRRPSAETVIAACASEDEPVGSTATEALAAWGDADRVALDARLPVRH